YTVCPGIYYLDGEDNQNSALVISGNGTRLQIGTAGVGLCPLPGTTAGTSPWAFNQGVTFVATCSGDPNLHEKANCGGAFTVGGTGSNTPTVGSAANPLIGAFFACS